MTDDLDLVLGQLTDRLTATGKLVTTSDHDDSPLVRAEGMRHLTRLMVAAAQTSMEAVDLDYPQFVQILSPHLQYGIPAVDCCYHYAVVRGGHSYRIFGTRGSAHMFHVESSQDIVPHLDRWTRHAGLEEFTVGSSGELEITLSREKADGDWIALPEDDRLCGVLVRQYFYDWDTEQPAELYIERLGATYPPPPYSLEKARAGWTLLGDFFDTVPRVCAGAVEAYYAADPNVIPFAPLPFGWKDLSYGMGHFRCETDEAVILEVVPPDCEYWGFQLMNHQWEALDWHLRQTSLNGHQARIDPDGVFRAVISHRDPGVHNWLDPAGRTLGLIAGRYFRPPANTSPARLITVPFEAVGGHLPAGTPRITSTERDKALRARMLSVRRRRCD